MATISKRLTALLLASTVIISTIIPSSMTALAETPGDTVLGESHGENTQTPDETIPGAAEAENMQLPAETKLNADESTPAPSGTRIAIDEKDDDCPCAQGEQKGHVWDAGEVIRQATCCREGQIRYTCSLCGSYYIDRTAKDPQTHDPELEEYNYTDRSTRAPSSLRGGTANVYCSGCGRLLRLGEKTARVSVSGTNKITLTRLPLYGIGLNKPIRILFVGNSFSTDTAARLYTVLHSAGYTDVLIGKIKKRGAALDGNIRRAKKDQVYDTFKYVSTKTRGKWVGCQGCSERSGLSKRTLYYAIHEFPELGGYYFENNGWDIIFIQQQSDYAGKLYTYYNDNGTNNTEILARECRSLSQSSSVKLGWIMTWALPRSNTDSLKAYGTQMDMYNDICSCVKTAINSSGEFDLLAPVGTAVQNARNSFLGDTINRDKRHLTMDVGRSLAALTIAYSIGADMRSLQRIKNAPKANRILGLLTDCAKKAIASPYKVTYRFKAFAKVTSGRKIKVSWGSDTGALRYTIMVSTNGRDYRKAGTAGAGSSSFIYKGKWNTACSFRIIASHLNGESSETFTGTVGLIRKPAGLTVRRSGDQNIRVSWKKAKGVSGYQLQVKQKGEKKWETIRITSSKTLSRVVKDLRTGRTYSVRIRAYKKIGRQKYYSKWAKKAMISL